MTIPIKRFNKIFHIGTMNPEHKRNGSYEGTGLSVSVHPDAWLRIGRGLVNGDTWSLSKEGGLFLDALKLTKKQKIDIMEQAFDAGWTEKIKTFTVKWYDSEDEDYRYMIMADKKKAEDEADEMDGVVIEKMGWNASGQLIERLGWKPEIIILDDIILTIHVEDNTELDGVWWNEKLDVMSCSAPRGVIVPSKVSFWSATCTPSISP